MSGQNTISPPQHILILEPNQRLARIYEQFLLKYGYSVALVREAQSAVFAADQQRPDLVIAELQLPGHNGIEFLYEFRSYWEWRDIPILIQTLVPAHALQIEQATIDRLGIGDILYKPGTTLETLKFAVSNLLTTDDTDEVEADTAVQPDPVVILQPAAASI